MLASSLRASRSGSRLPQTLDILISSPRSVILKALFNFLLDLAKLLRGDVWYRVSILLVAGGISSLTGDWLQTAIEAIIEKTLSVKVAGVAGNSIGMFLLALGLVILFGRGAYKHRYRAELPPIERLSVARAKFRLREQKLEDLLRDLVRVHSTNYSNHPHFSPLAIASSTGDRLSLATYLSSVLVGSQPSNLKTQVFTVVDDMTNQPVAHKYIREFENFLIDAKQVGVDDTIANTPFSRAYQLLTDPMFEPLRRAAGWPKDWRNI